MRKISDAYTDYKFEAESVIAPNKPNKEKDGNRNIEKRMRKHKRNKSGGSKRIEIGIGDKTWRNLII